MTQDGSSVMPTEGIVPDQEYNYLFVSDFHIAMGRDPEHGIFHPREDFFYDDAFYRFLKWADRDENREGGKPWELVFVGDCFDFLPVELTWIKEYETSVQDLAATLTSKDEQGILRAWQRFFYEATLPQEFRERLFDSLIVDDLVGAGPGRGDADTDGSLLYEQGRRDLARGASVELWVEDLEPWVEKMQSRFAADEAEFEGEGRWAGDLEEDPSMEDVAGEPEPEADAEAHLAYSHPCDYDSLFGADWTLDYQAEREYDNIEIPNAVRLPRWAEARLARERGDLYSATASVDQRARYGMFLKAKPAQGRELTKRWVQRLQLWWRNRRTYKDYQYDLFLKQTASVQKLCTIYWGHRKFFEALAWWVGQGHGLVVIAGNHDLEICWKGVQEKFKELLAYEYRCLTQRGTGGATPKPDMKAFEDRIDFTRQWFYYRPGVFYAEHGSQYDNGNATVNHLDPWWERTIQGKKEVLLNPSFGSLGNPIVSSLEDSSPHWENVGSHGSTLTHMIREYPWRYARILSSKLWQYADLILVLLNGTRGKPREQGPKPERFADYGALPGHQQLPSDLLPTLYFSWDQPLLLYRLVARSIAYGMRVLAIPLQLLNWLLNLLRGLLSPGGLLTLVVLLLLGVLLRPDLFEEVWKWLTGQGAQEQAGLYEAVQKILGLLGPVVITLLLGVLASGFKQTLVAYFRGKDEKRFQIALYGDEYVQEAGRQTFELFEQRAADSTHKPPFAEEDLPRYYIFGHDHIPAKILLKEGDIWSGNRHVYYFNTGSWLSWFAGEDVRRLRTGGGDLEFTFLKIWKRSDEWSYQDDEYDARLLRWNDAAGRAEDQLVIGPKKEEDSFIPALLRPMLFVACLFAAIGLYVGVGQGNWLISVILGLVLGAVVGLGLYLGAQRRLSGQTEA